MKILKYLLILMMSISIVSCEDDDDKIIIMPPETLDRPVSLEMPAITEVEVIENKDDQVGNVGEKITFTWNESKGNYNGAVLYFLQIDKKGNNFKDAVYLPLDSEGSTEKSIEVTYQELNDAINQINNALETSGSSLAIDFSQNNEFELRVISKAQLADSKMISEPIAINIKAYEEIINIEPSLYLVGSVQQYYGESQWNPEKALPMRYIGDGTTKVFEAYVKAKKDDIFKFVGSQDTWGEVKGNFGSIEGEPGKIKDGSDGGITIEENGQYYVKVNLDEMTYQLVKMQWGVIGSATPDGWDAETPMEYDVNTNTWKVDISLIDGEIKFRSKQLSNEVFGTSEDWKFNVGTDTSAYDVADGNMTVTAGATTLTLQIGFNGQTTVSGI